MRKKFNSFFWGVLQWLPLILIFVSFIMFIFINQKSNINDTLIYNFIENDRLINLFNNFNFINIESLLTKYLGFYSSYPLRLINNLINWFILVYIVEILYLVFTYVLKIIKRSVDL